MSSTKDNIGKAMFRCSAPSCKNNSSKSKRDDEGNKITYHMFPHGRPSLCMKWVYALKEAGKDPNWTPSAHSKLCSVHFDKKYIVHSASQPVLASDAVPTIFSLNLSKLKSNCTAETLPVSTSEQVSNGPDLSEELYILNLLTETQELNINASLLLDPIGIQLDIKEKENHCENPTLSKKSTSKEETSKNVKGTGTHTNSTSSTSHHYSRMELAIEIPEYDTTHGSQSTALDHQNILCIAGKSLLPNAKTKTEKALDLSIDAPKGEAGKPRSALPITTTESRLQLTACTCDPVIVGGTEPFVDDEGVENEQENWQGERSRENTGSLLGFLAKLKKSKVKPESNTTDNYQHTERDTIDQYKDSKSVDIFSKIPMRDLIEVLAQAELAGILADSFNVNSACTSTQQPTSTQDTDSNGDSDTDFSYQEALALVDHFDASVANFFMLEKAEAAMPRLEAMIDSFMYFYGLTEADLGYVLHDAPAPFSSEFSAVSNPQSDPDLPPVQMEAERPGELFTTIETSEDMDTSETNNDITDIELDNVVMVEAPQGITQFMDMATILEQQDIEEFIHTLNF